MSDIRVLGTVALILILMLGLLFAKAFQFSYEFVLWPIGFISTAWTIFCLFISSMNVQ